MTSDRIYKKRLSFREARLELKQGAGTQFDADVVDAFIEALDRRALAGGTGLLADFAGPQNQLPS